MAIVIKHPGALTRYAKLHHTTVAALVAHTPANASGHLKKMINFARNARHFHHGKK